MYAIHNDEAEVTRALQLCRGQYQRNLILGYEALSGATLQGKAKTYGARYAESRHNLLTRLRDKQIKVREERGPHGKRILVIG